MQIELQVAQHETQIATLEDRIEALQRSVSAVQGEPVAYDDVVAMVHKVLVSTSAPSTDLSERVAHLELMTLVPESTLAIEELPIGHTCRVAVFSADERRIAARKDDAVAGLGLAALAVVCFIPKMLYRIFSPAPKAAVPVEATPTDAAVQTAEPAPVADQPAATT